MPLPRGVELSCFRFSEIDNVPFSPQGVSEPYNNDGVFARNPEIAEIENPLALSEGIRLATMVFASVDIRIAPMWKPESISPFSDGGKGKEAHPSIDRDVVSCEKDASENSLNKGIC